jgi:phosphoribosylanthranilate isomerase
VVKVKICGITSLEDAMAAAAAGADAVGFVFAESKRKITPERAREIIRKLPPFITPVGVFVDEEEDRVREILRFCNIPIAQFHGEEPPDFCAKFRSIKAFKITEIDRVFGYRTSAWLIDSEIPGSGKKFNWSLVKELVKEGRVIIAGGLTPNNVSDVVREISPYGVDVSSGVEEAPGVKDHKKMKEFVQNAKTTR